MGEGPRAVRLEGEPQAVAHAARRLAEAGVAIVQDRAAPLVWAGSPLALPPRQGPRLLVAPLDDFACARLRAGDVDDLVSPDAGPDELAARVARLVREAPGASGSPSRLLDLTRELALASDLHELLLRVVQELAEALEVSRCSLVLFEETQGEPSHGTVVATSDNPSLRELRIELESYPEIREALRTRQPVLVADAASHPLLDPVRETLQKAGVSALAVFPLMLEGRVAGVLFMRAGRPIDRPGARELAGAAAVAASIVARHARLLERTRGEAARDVQRHEELIRHLGDGVAVLDQDGSVLLLNPAGARILGVAPDEARGRKLLEVARPADPAAAVMLARELGRGARIVEADLHVLRGDGRPVVLAVSAGRLMGGYGRDILSFRDVTEQRQTQADLRRTKDFLERIIDGSTDAIVAADLRGRMLVFSRAAEQLFQTSAEKARAALRVHDLYAEGGAREVWRMLKESPRGQIEQVRTYGRTAAGELIPIELSASIVRVEGRPVATVGVIRDLRERVRVESELARARSRLTEAEKQAAITALAGATAHELNQPLTVITGWVELLRRRTDDQNRPALEAIAAEAERMSQIVRRIAKIVRVETMAYPGDRQIADLEKSAEPRTDPPVVVRR